MGFDLTGLMKNRKLDRAKLCALYNRLSYDPYFWFLYLIGRLNPFLIKNHHKLLDLKNRYRGNRCFIMGNGPSLKRIDLEKLKNEYVWGMNRCYLLFDKISWRPQFYTAVDDLVVPDICEELNDMVRQNLNTLFFFSDNFFYTKVIRDKPNIVWFRHRGVDAKKGGDGYFSCKPSKYVRISNTVTLTAMQLAVYMGFNPIILIGCDTKFVLPDNIITHGSVFDSGTGELISGYNITSTKDNDPNHFDPSYFGAKRKWHAPNVSGMINGYKNANIVCKRLGIEVTNATKGGKLEVFTRNDFNDLFEENLL